MHEYSSVYIEMCMMDSIICITDLVDFDSKYSSLALNTYFHIFVKSYFCIIYKFTIYSS